MQPYEIERLAQQIRREIEPKIAVTTRQMEAELDDMRQFGDGSPALIRATLDAGNPSPAIPAPASSAPEPTLAQRLEAVPPNDFYADMRADAKGLMAKIAEEERE